MALNRSTRQANRQVTPSSSGKVTVKINPANKTSGKARHKDLQKALMGLATDLAAPPDTFDSAKQYRVKLNAVVTIPGTTHVLRPSQDVIVSGEFAQTIKASIAGAKAL
jgi:hypothetical protein